MLVAVQDIYPADALVDAKVALISQTNMIDYVQEILSTARGADAAMPEGLAQRREEVVATLERLQEEAGPLIEVVGDDDLINDLIDNKLFTMAHLGA